MGDVITWIIIIGLSALAIFLYWKFFKLYKVRNIVFIDGTLGSGKSFLSVAMAVRIHKKQVRIYKIKKWFLKNVAFLFVGKKAKDKADKLEKPELYSNIKLRNIEYIKLTKDLIQRKNYRFTYKSTLLIDEFSLMADQYLFKNREVSERLSNFFKLFRHETRGGHIVINSQSTSDLHYSIKYVLSDYLYIHHTTKWIPFVSCLKVQEMAYCADKDGQHITNARNTDVEETCKTILVFKKYYKYYDSYCYSIFTDGLPIYRKLEFNQKKDDLKDADLISFKEYQYLLENLKNAKGEEENEKNQLESN